MASSKRTKLTWRVQGIHQGTTEDELLSFFAGKDQERITICSLYPDVLGQDKLVATVRFNPHPEFPLEGPKKNFHAPRDMEIDKEFDGFTTLYSPPESMYIAAEYVSLYITYERYPDDNTSASLLSQDSLDTRLDLGHVQKTRCGCATSSREMHQTPVF